MGEREKLSGRAVDENIPNGELAEVGVKRRGLHRGKRRFGVGKRRWDTAGLSRSGWRGDLAGIDGPVRRVRYRAVCARHIATVPHLFLPERGPHDGGVAPLRRGVWP